MKIGVLGLGSIGSRHARNLRAMGHEVLEYDVAKANGGMGRLDVINAAEAFVIATPTSEHYNDFLDCMTRPVLVEKPIGMTREELFVLRTRDMSRAMTACNLRFHAAVRKVKEWMTLGLIGQPLWAHFTVGQLRDDGKYGEDGVILSSGAHEVDLAYHLLGPAKVVAASANSPDTIADAVLLHDNGCRTTVHMDWVSHPEVRNGTICGTKARVVFELAPGRAYYRVTRDGVLSQIYACDDSFDQNYVEEMAAFVDFAQGKPLVGASGADGLAVLGLLLDIREMAGLET